MVILHLIIEEEVIIIQGIFGLGICEVTFFSARAYSNFLKEHLPNLPRQVKHVRIRWILS